MGGLQLEKIDIICTVIVLILSLTPVMIYRFVLKKPAIQFYSDEMVIARMVMGIYWLMVMILIGGLEIPGYILQLAFLPVVIPVSFLLLVRKSNRKPKYKKEYICKSCGSILSQDLDRCNVCGSRTIRRLV